MISERSRVTNGRNKSQVGEMDLEITKSGEVRDQQTSYDITYMWDLKKWYKWTYLQNRNRFVDIENLCYQSGGGINKEFGIRWYTLLDIK